MAPTPAASVGVAIPKNIDPKTRITSKEGRTISLKNIINLEHKISEFVQCYYNHQRVHESLDNLTPADVCCGRATEIAKARDEELNHEIQTNG